MDFKAKVHPKDGLNIQLNEQARTYWQTQFKVII